MNADMSERNGNTSRLTTADPTVRTAARPHFPPSTPEGKRTRKATRTPQEPRPSGPSVPAQNQAAATDATFTTAPLPLSRGVMTGSCRVRCGLLIAMRFGIGNGCHCLCSGADVGALIVSGNAGSANRNSRAVSPPLRAAVGGLSAISAHELIERLVAQGRVRITGPDDDEVAEESADKRIEKVPYGGSGLELVIGGRSGHRGSAGSRTRRPGCPASPGSAHIRPSLPSAPAGPSSRDGRAPPERGTGRAGTASSLAGMEIAVSWRVQRVT